jgi:hypothetical protein
MEVNRELPNLADGLGDSVHLLTPGGRVLVLAYHSLEDRLVKQQLAEWAGEPPARPAHPARPPVPQGPGPDGADPHPSPVCGPVRSSSRRTRARPACACAPRSGSRHEVRERVRIRARPAPGTRKEREQALVSAISRSSTRPRASVSGGRALGVRVAVASVVAAVLIVVTFHVMMAEGQLQLDRLEQSTAKEQQRYEALRLQYARADRTGGDHRPGATPRHVPARSTRYVSAPGLTAEAAESPARMRRRAASPGIGRR